METAWDLRMFRVPSTSFFLRGCDRLKECSTSWSRNRLWSGFANHSVQPELGLNFPQDSVTVDQFDSGLLGKERLRTCGISPPGATFVVDAVVETDFRRCSDLTHEHVGG